MAGASKSLPPIPLLNVPKAFGGAGDGVHFPLESFEWTKGEPTRYRSTRDRVTAIPAKQCSRFDEGLGRDAR
jgi:hypothetical protein